MYAVYNPLTGFAYKGNSLGAKRYETLVGARRGAVALNKRNYRGVNTWAAVALVDLPKQPAPGCCDQSREAYWST